MSRLLDPQTLMAIKDLQLAAKTAAEGVMAGLHRSNAKGSGMEFSQYRSYQPGDDLRMMDWKLFARSDRYYIREAETERSVTVRIMVDASASMNHADGHYTKLEYARYLAASLAYLASQQGDAVGLLLFEAGRLLAVPPRNGPQHMARLYHQLESVRAGGRFTDEIHYRSLVANAGKKELVIFITDYYEQQNELTNLLTNLAAQRQEVMVLHLMGRNEMQLDYKGYTAVEDMETGQTIAIDLQQAAKGYQQQLQAHLSDIKSQLSGKNIYHRLVQTNEPFDIALRDFVQHRNRLKS